MTNTSTISKDISIKEFVTTQAVSLSRTKEELVSLAVKGSLAEEILKEFVFTLDLPFINSKVAKSFITKVDIQRLRSQMHNGNSEIQLNASGVVALLDQYTVEEPMD